MCKSSEARLQPFRSKITGIENNYVNVNFLLDILFDLVNL